MVAELVRRPADATGIGPRLRFGNLHRGGGGAVHGVSAGVRPWNRWNILGRLRAAVTGIDVHPAAVHLARASWALAAREAVNAAANYNTEISAPIYLGDALQLRYRTGDMFAEHTRHHRDPAWPKLGSPTLDFPMTLVERAETFDRLMADVADAIERGNDPLLALDDNGVVDPCGTGRHGPVHRHHADAAPGGEKTTSGPTTPATWCAPWS